MSDFSDTSYYDGSFQSATDDAIAAGTTTDYGTSADWTSASYDASSASWDAWGDSIQADSYANEAWYAGDYEASQAWSQISDGYEADSNAADAASWSAWDASGDAYADESAAWDADYGVYDSLAYDSSGYDSGYDDGGWDGSYDYSSSYDAGGYDTGSYDAGGYDAGGYDAGGYDYSSSTAGTDVVTDYYTSADW